MAMLLQLRMPYQHTRRALVVERVEEVRAAADDGAPFHTSSIGLPFLRLSGISAETSVILGVRTQRRGFGAPNLLLLDDATRCLSSRERFLGGFCTFPSGPCRYCRRGESQTSLGRAVESAARRARIVRIRSSAWGRPDRIPGGNSWTPPPPPPPQPPATPSPPPLPPVTVPLPPPLPRSCHHRHQPAKPRRRLLRPGLLLPEQSLSFSSWTCHLRYIPRLSNRARRTRPVSRSLRTVVRPSAKMNSVKDATLPISVPPSGDVLLQESKVKSSRMSRRGAMVALSYMLCAVMLVMFNKAALSTYRFPCANVITVLQMLCSTSLLYVLRKLDVITFASDGSTNFNLAEDGFVTLKTLRRATPLSISYLFYMILGMASIRGVNVPMYTTLRRTTVLFTMVLEYFLAGQKHTTPVASSVGFIVMGAFIAGARDLSFDANGYSLVLCSNLTTALYLTTISRLGKSTGLNSFGLMWCNGLICGPILLLWIMVSGELGLALQFPAIMSPSFQLVIMLSCMMAFCLNYTIFLNTSLNSPLTQTMCGNLKDFGTVLIGWILFGGLPFDWLNVLGQILGFLGSGLYAYCKIKGI